jgi:hypothetical protein
VTSCKIRWIDDKGNPTPDANDSVGECWIVAHEELIEGRLINIPESEHFPICCRHYDELWKAGMEHWHFEPYANTAGFKRKVGV